MNRILAAFLLSCVFPFSAFAMEHKRKAQDELAHVSKKAESTITLLTSDDTEVIVPESIARISPTLRDLLDSLQGHSRTIPLPELDSKPLKSLFKTITILAKYCNNRHIDFQKLIQQDIDAIIQCLPIFFLKLECLRQLLSDEQVFNTIQFLDLSFLIKLIQTKYYQEMHPVILELIQPEARDPFAQVVNYMRSNQALDQLKSVILHECSQSLSQDFHIGHMVPCQERYTVSYADLHFKIVEKDTQKVIAKVPAGPDKAKVLLDTATKIDAMYETEEGCQKLGKLVSGDMNEDELNSFVATFFSDEILDYIIDPSKQIVIDNNFEKICFCIDTKLFVINASTGHVIKRIDLESFCRNPDILTMINAEWLIVDIQDPFVPSHCLVNINTEQMIVVLSSVRRNISADGKYLELMHADNQKRIFDLNIYKRMMTYLTKKVTLNELLLLQNVAHSQESDQKYQLMPFESHTLRNFGQGDAEIGNIVRRVLNEHIV